MSISAGKKRRSVTLSEDTWSYLEKRLNERIKKNFLGRARRYDTISYVIEEIVLADKKVYEAFKTGR